MPSVTCTEDPRLRKSPSSYVIYFAPCHQDDLLQDPPQLLASLTMPTLPGETEEDLTFPNATTMRHIRPKCKGHEPNP